MTGDAAAKLRRCVSSLFRPTCREDRKQEMTGCMMLGQVEVHTLKLTFLEVPHRADCYRFLNVCLSFCHVVTRVQRE